MPWDVTDQYIRSGHKAPGETCRTITISAEQGIKAIYCKYGDKWGIQSYLFDKDKWTLDRAKEWFSSHNEQIVKAFEEVNMHPHFQRILSLFTQKYGEEEGRDRFNQFVTEHGLNVEIPYHPSVQFREAFNWAKPGLRKLREDKDAKYYAVNAIHAIVSMNNNDYTDWKKMVLAGESINYRPVNINHDHSRWLPYPRTRLDYGKAEDYQVEGILRVANEDAWLQKAIEHDPSIPKKQWVSCPSIEGRPNLDGEGYHFTAIAMLEMGYSLPGDPMSDVKPMMLESAGQQICMLIDDTQICLPCVEQTPDKCICPECGEIVNNPDNKHCSEILCPRCKASMRAQTPGTGGGKGQGGPPEKVETGNKSDDEMSQEYQTGPLQRGGAICPSCGHVVPETVTDVTEIACPICHTKMTVWKNLTYEQVIEELSKQGIKLDEEKLKELFRPPFPETPNPMFTKTMGADLKTANIPTVGPIDGAKIGIVENTRLKADFEEYKLSKENEVADLKAQGQRDRQENITLHEKIAKLELSLAEKSAMEATLHENIQKLGKANATITTLQSTVTELKKQAETYRESVKAKESETDEVRTELAKTRARLDDTITQLHEASERSSTNTQKAINETQERSRIQEENATLREKIAKLTREISNLTEKASEDAGRLIKLEEELAEVKRRVIGEKAILDNQLQEKQVEVEKARKYLKWANKALIDAGFVQIQVEK